MSGRIGFCLALGLMLAACGGSSKGAEAPSSEPESSAETSSAPATPGADADQPAASEPSESEAAAEPKPADNAAEPQFTENMSVDEAINAVPRGVERRNMDPETLAKPLQNLDVYEPCKPGSAKVKLRVAVWDGKAVGVDVTTTPKNEKLAGCIKNKLRELTWDKKLKSLNTIEYQF